MEVSQENNNGIRVFRVKGSLDSNTSAEFENQIVEALEQGNRKLIFNLEDMDYISSAGIRVMLKTAKDLKRMEGSLVLCSLQDYVQEVFDIAGFDDYLNIEQDIDAAMVRF